MISSTSISTVSSELSSQSHPRLPRAYITDTFFSTSSSVCALVVSHVEYHITPQLQALRQQTHHAASSLPSSFHLLLSIILLYLSKQTFPLVFPRSLPFICHYFSCSLFLSTHGRSSSPRSFTWLRLMACSPTAHTRYSCSGHLLNSP